MRTFTIWVVLLGMLSILHGKAQPTEYKIQSVFIYNFAKYTQWPNNSQSGDFVIEVLGKSPLGSELEKLMMNKTVGMQKITVRQIQSPEQISTCHIVIVPESESKYFEAVQARLKGKPTLLITGKPGLGQKGSSINFVVKDNKWSYELNQATLGANGLRVSAEISRLAINI